jgi:hypothetical protein
MVAAPLGRLDPSARRSEPTLEPSEGEQDERYDERTDRVLDGDVSGARLEPRENRGKATRWNEPVHGGDGKEQDAKKSRDQRQGSVHRADVREDYKFSVTLPPRDTEHTLDKANSVFVSDVATHLDVGDRVSMKAGRLGQAPNRPIQHSAGYPNLCPYHKHETAPESHVTKSQPCSSRRRINGGIQ